MRKEKILKALEEEFDEHFIVWEDYDRIFVHCDINDYTIAFFGITKEHEVDGYVLEEDSMTVRSLPCVKLETEDQVIQLVKSGYRYLRNEYSEVY